jgi:hypothetical protein
MKNESRQLKELFLCIAPARFYFLKNILEGYDGLACLSSLDGKLGTARLRYPADSETVLFDLLSFLAKDINPYHFIAM